MEFARMSNTDERITRLVETVAHQAKTMFELSVLVAELWLVVEQARATLDRLTERFLTLEEQSLDAPAITKPPHY
jgi:SlyX protein